MHQLLFGWLGSEFACAYQAIQGRFAEQENSVHRVHSYQQLPDEWQVSKLIHSKNKNQSCEFNMRTYIIRIVIFHGKEWKNDEPKHAVRKHHCPCICLYQQREEVRILVPSMVIACFLH